MNSPAIDEIKNWIPWKLLKYSGEPSCSWLYTGGKRFTEPFFDDTIAACRTLPENCKPFKVATSVSMLTEWAKNADVAAPEAIVFHVSRCGSTLLSQLLALDEANIVLSEVPFFDEILRLPFKSDNIDGNTLCGFLKAAITLYGRKQSNLEKNLFVKTDSWHIHFYEKLRALYPTVPFIFLYRNPWEVILSQQRQRGMHAVPGLIEPQVFEFAMEQTNAIDFDRYIVRVVEGYFSKMIAIAQSDPLVIPVNYNEGMTTILKKIYSLNGLSLAEDTENLLNERSRFHAKKPDQLFEEKNKELPMPPYSYPALELYQQLDQIRLAKIQQAFHIIK